MIINDNNKKADKRKKHAHDYFQKQLDYIMEQKKSKKEQVKETKSRITLYSSTSSIVINPL